MGFFDKLLNNNQQNNATPTNNRGTLQDVRNYLNYKGWHYNDTGNMLKVGFDDMGKARHNVTFAITCTPSYYVYLADIGLYACSDNIIEALDYLNDINKTSQFGYAIIEDNFQVFIQYVQNNGHVPAALESLDMFINNVQYLLDTIPFHQYVNEGAFEWED